MISPFQAPKYTPITKHQQDVSASAMEQWEKELMEDPKVCDPME
jgi:bleomycin hydrolase